MYRLLIYYYYYYITRERERREKIEGDKSLALTGNNYGTSIKTVVCLQARILDVTPTSFYCGSTHKVLMPLRFSSHFLSITSPTVPPWHLTPGLAPPHFAFKILIPVTLWWNKLEWPNKFRYSTIVQLLLQCSLIECIARVGFTAGHLGRVAGPVLSGVPNLPCDFKALMTRLIHYYKNKHSSGHCIRHSHNDKTLSNKPTTM